MAEFYMTIGISGSGKSTYLQKFEKDSVICPDDIRRELTGDISDQSQNARVWAVAKERILERLANGQLTVLDATNVNSKLRKKFLKDIPSGTKLVAVVFPMPDISEAFKRIQTDIMEGKDRSNVPFDIIQKQENSYKNGLVNVKDQFDKIVYLKENLEEMVITDTNK